MKSSTKSYFIYLALSLVGLSLSSFLVFVIFEDSLSLRTAYGLSLGSFLCHWGASQYLWAKEFLQQKKELETLRLIKAPQVINNDLEAKKWKWAVTAFAQNPLPMIVFDMDGRVRKVNLSMSQFLETKGVLSVGKEFTFDQFTALLGDTAHDLQKIAVDKDRLQFFQLISRLEKVIEVIEVKKDDLVLLLEDVVESLQSFFIAEQVIVEFSTAESGPILGEYADYKLALQRIIKNLVRAKYTMDQGNSETKLSLKTIKQDERVHLQIQINDLELGPEILSKEIQFEMETLVLENNFQRIESLINPVGGELVLKNQHAKDRSSRSALIEFIL